MFLVKLIIVICFVGIATSSPMSGDLSTALLEQPIKPPSPNRSIKFHHHSTNTVGQLTILSKKWSVVSELHCARGCLDITGCQATIFIQEKFLCVLLKMSQKHDQETVVYDNPDVWLKKDAKEATCRKPFRRFEHGCYLLATDYKSWHDAESYCRSYGENVHLVRSDTPEKRSELESLTSQPIWIGANDTYGDNVIRYLGDGGAIIPDDSPLWGIYPPYHGISVDNDCVTKVSYPSYLLRGCTYIQSYVCEIYQ